jgi:hypothetical protein
MLYSVHVLRCAIIKRFSHICKIPKTLCEIINKQIHRNLHNSTNKELPKLKAEQIGIEAGSDTTCKHNI